MPAVRDPGVCCVRPEDISGRSRRLESGSVNGASHSNARITEDFEMSENIHEECGVFGVYAKEQSDVAGIAYYGLYALQPVSYTHLDVYKRQLLCRSSIRTPRPCSNVPAGRV